MEQKYKIRHLAKDLNISPNEVAEIVNTLLGLDKKPSGTLVGEELDIVLEKVTQSNEVKSFKEYFDTAKLKEKKEEPKPEESKTNKAPAAAVSVPKTEKVSASVEKISDTAQKSLDPVERAKQEFMQQKQKQQQNQPRPQAPAQPRPQQQEQQKQPSRPQQRSTEAPKACYHTEAAQGIRGYQHHKVNDPPKQR